MNEVKLKAIFHLPVTATEALKKVSNLLAKDHFIFSEEDKTYTVRNIDGKIQKTLVWVKFWSRKTLGNNHPPSFSLIIEGEIRRENDGSIIELEFIEYHTNRPHYLSGEGGAASIDDYFAKLIREIY